MNITWYQVAQLNCPCLVVADATEASRQLWDGPYSSILQEVAERMPDGSNHVCFLGDHRIYPLMSILDEGYDIGSQLGRYPVIGPSLWQWSRGQVGPILVVSTTTILDLADWIGSDVVSRLCVYRPLGAGRVSPPGFREYGDRTDLAEVIEHLRSPLSRVEVGGPGILPLEWPRASFQVTDNRLTATANVAGAVVQLAHPPDRPPTATYTFVGGAWRSVELVRCQAPTSPLAVSLTPGEQTALRQWALGHSFWCSRCGQNHAPGVAKCSHPTGLFPSLPSGTYRVVPVGYSSEWTAFPVTSGRAVGVDGRVLVSTEGGFIAHTLTANGWEAGEVLEPLPEVEPGGYLVQT